MSDFRPLHEWNGPPGSLVVWRPTPDTWTAVREAATSPVPPSHEQEQHLWAYRACERQQSEMARLLIVTWQEPGLCDVRTMTQVLNAYLQHHDTYHSWFQEQDGVIQRRLVQEPGAIRLEAVDLGIASANEWQAHVASTPSPFDWDCFRFGIIQRPDSFTCFASIDHPHTDGSVAPLVWNGIQREYHARVNGDAATSGSSRASYLDYCAAQRQRTAVLTLADPAVAGWLEALHAEGGHLPRTPLDLGDVPSRSPAEHVTMDLLDAPAADRFDAACREVGARGLGGVLACAALAERSMLGTRRFGAVTPTTTRKTAEQFRMAGWCMGVVPISLDIADASFRELAAAAQRCFGERRPLADVPIERVFELARDVPGIDHTGAGAVMVSYMDTSLPPFTRKFSSKWDAARGQVFMNPGVAGQVALWFWRTPRGLGVSAAYPATATARASVAMYLHAIREACLRAT